MFKHIQGILALPLLLLLLSACASNQGIFASGNWQAGGLAKQHIHTLAVDPNNLQNIYAGDAQEGVYYSADGGLHWQRRSAGLPTPTAVYTLAFDEPGKTLYAATGTGMFTSSNGGQSWTIQSHLPGDRYTAIAFDLKAPQSIFVASLHHGLLYSSNAGLSWASMNAGLPPGATINSLSFDSNQHQLWAATNQGVYRSANNGTGWQVLNTGLPAGAAINQVLPASIVGGNADLVFAGTDQGFYLSQDNGAQWTASQTSLVHVNIAAITIDSQTVSTVYIATDKVGVLRSTDNGENWGGAAPGLPRGQAVYDVIQGATGDSQLIAAANDVYLFPGTGGGFDLSRLLPLLLGAVFFYLLYRISIRGRKKTSEMLKSERLNDSSEPGEKEDQGPP